MAISQGSTQTAINDASTGAKAGVTGDRLKVDVAYNASATSIPAIIKLAYDDMNASTGGIARGTDVTTSYSTIYNRSGNGYIFGFSVSFEGNIIGADAFILKFTVDSLVVAEINTLDIGSNAIYAAGSAGDALIWGFQTDNNNIMFKTPGQAGLKYTASVKIEIKKAGGSAKQFRAGIIALTKE